MSVLVFLFILINARSVCERGFSASVSLLHVRLVRHLLLSTFYLFLDVWKESHYKLLVQTLYG